MHALTTTPVLALVVDAVLYFVWPVFLRLLPHLLGCFGYIGSFILGVFCCMCSTFRRFLSLCNTRFPMVRDVCTCAHVHMITHTVHGPLL